MKQTADIISISLGCCYKALSLFECFCNLPRIKELKINDKKDISKYVTDIIYNDSKGWISLIYGTYKCFLERIDNELYLLDFYCNTIDDEEEFSIVLNEKINFILNHEEQ